MRIRAAGDFSAVRFGSRIFGASNRRALQFKRFAKMKNDTTEYIHIENATENNLNHISLDIPKQKFIVITGPSGSGKSTLAFDTIYMESRRRYLDTLSMYAKQFVGPIRRPKVEKLTGISPAIAVVQGTLSNNPRSTLGTVTEIYDYLRLIWGRAGAQTCPKCRLEASATTEDAIIERVMLWPQGTRAIIYAPMIQDRKGEFSDLFETLRRSGLVRARVDGKDVLLESVVSLPKTVRHTIEAVVDRIIVKPDARARISQDIRKALSLGNGVCNIERLLNGGDAQKNVFSIHATCPKCGMSFPELSPNMLAFNAKAGQCPDCEGAGEICGIQPGRIFGDESDCIIPKGGGRSYIIPLNCNWASDEVRDCIAEAVEQFATANGLAIGKPWSALDPVRRGIFGRQLLSWFSGMLCNPELSPLVEPFADTLPCESCGGSRLNIYARNVYFAGATLADIQNKTVDRAIDFFEHIDCGELDPIAARILHELLPGLLERLRFLNRVGLGYLQIGRGATTLSGGESQRIRLATMLGNGLTAVTYVLDEPSIGLHPRDQARLIGVLQELRDRGNTVIAVEHDDATMRACDFLVDIGPRAGKFGGNVMYAGDIKNIGKCSDSLTIDYLAGRKSVPVPKTAQCEDRGFIHIEGARKNNLKNITVDIPLGRIVCITGVSGSGKSTLINEVLIPYAEAKLGGRNLELLSLQDSVDAIGGLEKIGRMLEVDQKPIGKTPRSNPATYTKVFDLIRELFANAVESKMYGYTASRYSFNVSGAKGGGRCKLCEGAGVRAVEMKYLADTYVECEECRGKRFNDATLRVRYNGRNIAQVLDMSFGEALIHFQGQTKITKILKAVCDVGLGYIKLGQPSPTLSGGEAQRLKLSKEIAKTSHAPTLFIFDEPSTGLHADDVRQLIQVFCKLRDLGHSVIIIEHNLDIIKTSDYIIDIGPEPGDGGGEIVAAGTPKDVAFHADTHTARFLRPLLDED